MGATAPINFEKSLIAPIDSDPKHYSMSRFRQFSSENGGCKEILHPLIEIAKEGPAFSKKAYFPTIFALCKV